MLWLVAVAFLAVVHASPLQPDSVLLQQKAQVTGFPNFVTKGKAVVSSGETSVYAVRLRKTAIVRQLGVNGALIKRLRNNAEYQNKQLLVREFPLNGLNKAQVKALCAQVPDPVQYVSWAECLYASADKDLTRGYELYSVPATAKHFEQGTLGNTVVDPLGPLALGADCGLDSASIWLGPSMFEKEVIVVGRPTCDIAVELARPRTVLDAAGVSLSVASPGITRAALDGLGLVADMEAADMEAEVAGKFKTLFATDNFFEEPSELLKEVRKWVDQYQLLVRKFPLVDGLTLEVLQDRCAATSSPQNRARGHLAQCVIVATNNDQGYELYAVLKHSALIKATNVQASAQIMAQIYSAGAFFDEQCLILNADKDDIWVSPTWKVQMVNAKFQRKADCDDLAPESLIRGRVVEGEGPATALDALTQSQQLWELLRGEAVNANQVEVQPDIEEEAQPNVAEAAPPSNDDGAPPSPLIDFDANLLVEAIQRDNNSPPVDVDVTTLWTKVNKFVTDLADQKDLVDVVDNLWQEALFGLVESMDWEGRESAPVRVQDILGEDMKYWNDWAADQVNIHHDYDLEKLTAEFHPNNCPLNRVFPVVPAFFKAINDAGGFDSKGEMCYDRYSWFPLPGAFFSPMPRVDTPNAYYKFPVHDDHNRVDWVANFADRMLFFGVTDGPMAQDEQLIVQFPALLSLREALAERYLAPAYQAGNKGRPAAVLLGAIPNTFFNVPRLNEYTGPWGNGFTLVPVDKVLTTFKRDNRPNSRHNVFTMTALRVSDVTHRNRKGQEYIKSELQQTLRIAYTAFMGVRLTSKLALNGAHVKDRDTSPAKPDYVAPAEQPSYILSGPEPVIQDKFLRPEIVVHSSAWGSGAFGNNEVVVALIQMAAAQLAGIDVLTLHHQHIDNTPTPLEDGPFNTAQALLKKWHQDEAQAGRILTVNKFFDYVVGQKFKWKLMGSGH